MAQKPLDPERTGREGQPQEIADEQIDPAGSAAAGLALAANAVPDIDPNKT